MALDPLISRVPTAIGRISAEMHADSDLVADMSGMGQVEVLDAAGETMASPKVDLKDARWSAQTRQLAVQLMQSMRADAQAALPQ